MNHWSRVGKADECVMLPLQTTGPDDVLPRAESLVPARVSSNNLHDSELLLWQQNNRIGEPDYPIFFCCPHSVHPKGAGYHFSWKVLWITSNIAFPCLLGHGKDADAMKFAEVPCKTLQCSAKFKSTFIPTALLGLVCFVILWHFL